MSRRQTEGKETWTRLINWDRGQAPSERLAAHILRIEGYESIDPSHPLGGQDGLKDAVCTKDKVRFIGACYFPRGEQNFGVIKTKFINDLKGVSKNTAEGIAFVTNQELTLSARDELVKEAGCAKVDLFHLERIASILDSPQCYGIRLEFLDIEMTKEEQVAFFGTVANVVGELQSQMRDLLETLNNANISSVVPTEQLAKFKGMLESIVGVHNSTPGIYSLQMFPAPIDKLRVPIDELARFKGMLESLVGDPSSYGIVITSPLMNRLSVPLDELKEFESILGRLVGVSSPFSVSPYPSPIHMLQVPLDSLRDYEQTLARILEKLERVEKLGSKQRNGK
jgi:hypothetical protein